MANKALVDPNALNDPFMRLNLAGSMFGEMLEVLFGPGEEPIMPPFSDFSGLLGNYGPQFMSLINHNSLEIIFKNEIIDLFRNSTLEGILPTQSSWGKSVDEVVSVIDSALVNPGASQPVPAYRPAPAPVPAPWAQPALQPVPASMPAPQPAPNSRPSPLPVGFRPFVVPEVGPHEMPAPLMVPALPPAIPGFTVHPIALPVPGGQAIVPAWLALPNGVDPYQPALVLSQPQIGVVLIPEVSPVPAPGMRAPEPAFRPVPYELEPGMAPGDVIVPVLQAPRSAFIPAPTPESRNASVPAIPASEILGAVNESQQEANIGLIAGLSIAGAAVLAALGALAVYYKKRPRRAASTEPAGTEMRQVVTEGVATPVPAADDLQPGAQGERANLDDVAVVVQGAAPGRAPSPTASEPARFPSGSTRGNEV